ncbi:serine hydrolase domain-containing protein [Leptospira alstonii]|uniref:Beta-lactamase n=2 Tax=Leptospira alstonii TaxID=28452 RepID=M6CWW8_9LEPT|nr:serine hydrolase domain-containing protein [Leptospira alstonii]EMJ90780.1 beta-lactamase [Leptospira alstonii serovar Sichuan str. 79601]EQA82535.1 beta-lactamase [Leptospira alstonii serovar Pingchang str. 80-412]
MKRPFLLPYTIILFCFCQCGWNMKNQTLNEQAKIKEYLRAEIKNNKFPAIQYVVVSDSEIFQFNEGLSNVSENTQITNDTTMMIYSMTKTITAISILQLVEQGKLFLDDSAIQYIPEIPYGKEVTIRRLLSQTSGIPNPIPLRWVHLREEHTKFDEQSSLQSVLSEYPELEFKPGQKYRYSNISYWLLGRIVAKVSGLSFEDYVRKNVFQRLNLKEQEANFIIPDSSKHAKGYLPKWSIFDILKSFLVDKKFIGPYEKGWLLINDHYMNGPSFGGMICSAYAFGLILQDLLKDHSKLLGANGKKLLFEQQRNLVNKPVEMTLGLHIGSQNKKEYYFKEGGGAGFHSEMRIYPKEKIGTVLIVNNGASNADSLMNTLDNVFLK